MSDERRAYHNSERVHKTTRGQPRPVFPHAISVEQGKMLYVSGQMAYDADGKIVGPGDMRAQYKQVCENLKSVLEDAGSSMDRIVKINTFLTDVSEHQNTLDIRAEYFGDAWPTSTTVEISKLATPGAMVEIEVVAMV